MWYLLTVLCLLITLTGAVNDLLFNSDYKQPNMKPYLNLSSSDPTDVETSHIVWDNWSDVTHLPRVFFWQVLKSLDFSLSFWTAGIYCMWRCLAFDDNTAWTHLKTNAPEPFVHLSSLSVSMQKHLMMPSLQNGDIQSLLWLSSKHLSTDCICPSSTAVFGTKLMWVVTFGDESIVFCQIALLWSF